jgi:hypothetical protein
MRYVRENWKTILAGGLILLLPSWAWASEAGGVQWGNLTMGLLGGLALFLLGMEMMRGASSAPRGTGCGRFLACSPTTG